VVDGNFKAEHMKMQRSQDDVPLMKGEGYMVEEGRYQEHLRASTEIKEVTQHIPIVNIMVTLFTFSEVKVL
jgi:hypothetical protein